MKNLLALFLPVSLVFLAACSSPSDESTSTAPQESIVHAKKIRNARELAKSVVAVVADREEGQALCTGSILSENIVLTAAHCVEGNPQQMSLIFANNIKKANSSQVRSVDTFEQNPYWQNPSASKKGDLALLHFTGGLPRGYQPVQLVDRATSLQEGDSVYFLGYGVTNGNTHAGSGVLRTTETTVLGEQSPTQIVTDGTKTSVCFGDSGGPAFIEQDGQWLQWGVASSVSSQSCNEVSIHTSVMSYESWIRTTSAKLSR
jgi:secreted trypsin-like serine protease